MSSTISASQAITLNLQLLSPTVIAQRPTSPGQVTRSAEYITGTVLRGGIAGLWRERYGESREEEFRRIFVSGQVRFQNAWPYHIHPRTREIQRTWIVPKSTAKDKRSGWFGDGDDGVQDLLTRLIRDEPPDDMEPVDDTFVSENTAEGQWQSLKIHRRLISRTAIIEALSGGISRGVAKDGQLYSFEALETGQQFRAVLRGPADLIDALMGLLGTHQTITIGQGRSRGMGQVATKPAQEYVVPEDDRAQLVEAILRFSQLAMPESATAESDTCMIPVTLESDTFLRDNYLLACSSADPKQVLDRYRPGMPVSMELEYAVQSTRWIGGWEQIRRLPCPPQLAVTQGSVWVFAVNMDELPLALDWWDGISVTGLGERCTEGFGQVRVMHPFHDYRDAEENRLW
jgi:CRISPR-associated protein Csx10